LEVRNGQDSGSAIARLSQVHNLFMLRVTFINIYSSGSSASIQAEAGQLSLIGVTFMNVTSSDRSLASVIAARNPADWLLEDVSFINCTSYRAAPVILSVILESADGNVTFAGNVSFVGSHSAPDQRSVYFSSSNYTLYLNSRADKPSIWTFIESRQTAITFHSGTSNEIQFEAASLRVSSSQEYVPGGSAVALQTLGSGTVSIFIHEWLNVDGLGVIFGRSFATNLKVAAGPIVSNLCHSAVALDLISCSITAENIFVSNPTYQTVRFTGPQSSNITVDSRLRIWRYIPPDSTTSQGISVTGGSHSIHVGESLIVEDLYATSYYGAALWVASGSLSIEADQVRFKGNTAYQGGAVGVSIDSHLSIHATNTIFQHNRAIAGHGGALGAETSSTLDLNGDIQFEGNTAELRGGALYIPYSQAHKFTNASFLSNQANEGCAVYFSDICGTFVANGTISSNIQLTTTHSCHSNDYMCKYRPPPSATSCLTSPPNIGSWVCVDGTWTSNGTITGETITIPGTQVVVDGNFTVPGSVVFDGLGSSIVVVGGCAHIGGSIVVELTEEELEQLAKESRTVALISQNSSCPSLSSSYVDGRLSSKSCRKIESTTSEEKNGSQSSLVAMFKVNSSGCNVKWIILGSVLGGVLLLIVIIMLVVTFNDKARKAIRPFWARGRSDL
jgi:predicted outer membrane repeat protein